MSSTSQFEQPFTEYWAERQNVDSTKAHDGMMHPYICSIFQLGRRFPGKKVMFPTQRRTFFFLTDHLPASLKMRGPET